MTILVATCTGCKTPTRDKAQEHPGICVCGGYIVDVAYMLVPRCDKCRHWQGDGHNVDSEGRHSCTELSISPMQMDELMTLPDFGCVKWEAK